MRKYFNSDFSYGVMLVALASMLWGLTYPLWKIIALSLPPLVLVFTTFILASVMTFLIDKPSIGVLYAKYRENRLPLIALGFSSGVLGTGLLVFSLTKIDSGVVSVLEKLQPVFTLLTARIFLGDHIPWKKTPLIIFSILCSGMISIGNPFLIKVDELQTLGILAAVAAAFFFGSNTVLSKYLIGRGVSSRQLIFYRMFLGGLMASVAFIDVSNVRALLTINFSTLLLLVVSAYLSLVLAFELFFSGLKHIDSATASYLELLTPVVAILLGYLFLDERLDMYQTLSLPVFFYSIVKLSQSKRSKAIIEKT